MEPGLSIKSLHFCPLVSPELPGYRRIFFTCLQNSTTPAMMAVMRIRPISQRTGQISRRDNLGKNHKAAGIDGHMQQDAIAQAAASDIDKGKNAAQRKGINQLREVSVVQAKKPSRSKDAKPLAILLQPVDENLAEDDLLDNGRENDAKENCCQKRTVAGKLQGIGDRQRP